MPNKSIIPAVCAALAAGLIAYIAWGNTALELNRYEIKSPELPAAFEGFRIVQISDLHNAQFGKNNQKLLSLIKSAEPNIIAITGDMIDSRRTNMAAALDFAKQATGIAPCYYVPGNHEARIAQYGEFKEKLSALGVIVLENEKLELSLGGESIALIGVADPMFAKEPVLSNETLMNRLLNKLLNGEEYSILLSHRPELFAVYAENGISLALCGHAHGGQIRLPFIGGILAPNQGFFPKYTAGIHSKADSTMVVSRGLGNSRFPFRFNNRPEVVSVELHCK